MSYRETPEFRVLFTFIFLSAYIKAFLSPTVYKLTGSTCLQAHSLHKELQSKNTGDPHVDQ